MKEIFAVLRENGNEKIILAKYTNEKGIFPRGPPVIKGKKNTFEILDALTF